MGCPFDVWPRVPQTGTDDCRDGKIETRIIMVTYHAKSTNGLSFEVRKDNEAIGQLTYSSWFKFNAVITVAGATYPVAPKGFWETSIEVRDGEKVLLAFSMGWKGEIVLRTYFNGTEQGYVFNHRGLFRESFI